MQLQVRDSLWKLFEEYENGDGGEIFTDLQNLLKTFLRIGECERYPLARAADFDRGGAERAIELLTGRQTPTRLLPIGRVRHIRFNTYKSIGDDSTVCAAIQLLDKNLFGTLTGSLTDIGQQLCDTFTKTARTTTSAANRIMFVTALKSVRRLLFGSILTAFAGDQTAAQRFVGVARFLGGAVPFLGNGMVCWIVR